MNYTEYVAALSNLLVVEASDADFVDILPRIIDYAEQRMYRELDLLNTVTRSTGTLSVGTRNFTLPQSNGRFVVTNGINVITPSSVTIPDEGTRNPLTPASLDIVDRLWPSVTGASVPTMYAMLTDQVIVVGPAPDQGYTVEVKGTIRPNALSASNPTTYLTLYLPDAFLACSMVGGAAWQKNFGAQADDPKMAMSWETQYQALFASANVEEQRKRYSAGGWASLSPTPIATPTR